MIKPRPSVLRLISQQLNFDKNSHHEIECRQNRVTERAIGPLHVGPLPAQNEQSAQRKNVKNQHRKNQKIEQLAVRSRKTQKRSPDALHDQTPRRRVVLDSPSPPI